VDKGRFLDKYELESMIQSGISEGVYPRVHSWLRHVLRLLSMFQPDDIRIYGAGNDDDYTEMAVTNNWIIETISRDPDCWTVDEFLGQPFVSRAFKVEGTENDHAESAMIRQITRDLGYGSNPNKTRNHKNIPEKEREVKYAGRML